MNGATFRALRETAGLSQRSAAEALGVTERTVKHWERGLRRVPDEVAEWAERAVAEHERAVSQAMDAAIAMARETNAALGLDEGTRPPIDLSYFRTQSDFDERGRDEGDYGVANARARAIGAALRGLGYRVVFRYPG